jgi:SAM-dependent methyltransferase
MNFSDKSKIVAEGYDQIADLYHSTRLAKKEINYRYFDELFHFFPDAGKLLDLGCGGGQPLTAYFADKGFEVTGVDISREMIEIARRQIPQGKFLVGDMVEGGFDNEEFDAIVSGFAIIHIPQERQEKLFQKIYDWLKQDGTAYLVLAHRETTDWIEEWHGVKMYWSHFDSEKYKEIIDKTGFKLVWDEVETLENGEIFYNVILKK